MLLFCRFLFRGFETALKNHVWRDKNIPLQLLQPQRRYRWEAVHNYITHSIMISVAINWKPESAFQFMTNSNATCKILQKLIEKAHYQLLGGKKSIKKIDIQNFMCNYPDEIKIYIGLSGLVESKWKNSQTQNPTRKEYPYWLWKNIQNLEKVN